MGDKQLEELMKDVEKNGFANQGMDLSTLGSSGHPMAFDCLRHTNANSGGHGENHK